MVCGCEDAFNFGGVMGKKITVIGDMGFCLVSFNDASNFNKPCTNWVTFPTSEFPNLITLIQAGGDPFEGFFWYLMTPPWALDEYDYLNLPKNFKNYVEWSYEKPVGVFFKNDEAKKKTYDYLSKKYESLELQLLNEVMSKNNTSPTLLYQNWFKDKKIDFDCLGELGEILYLVAINKKEFLPRIYQINDTDDFQIEFYKTDNNKPIGIMKSLGGLIPQKESKLIFSFRYSDLKEIITFNGRDFKITTRVGTFEI